jgi:Mechanosensitive ion channel, conserved TM helix
MAEAILLTLRETWSGYVEGLRLVIPRLLAMLTVVAAGWLIAAFARAVAAKLFAWLRVARLAERTGGAELLRKAELPPLERLAASLVFWLLFLGFLLAGVDALGFKTLQAMRSEIGQLVPRLLGALAILVVGLVLANVVRRIVLLAAVNAGWPRARLVGSAVHFLTVTIVAAMVLDHVGLAPAIVLTAFAIVVGAVMLALAIAIGVGSAPLVRRVLEERTDTRARPESDGSSHL